MYGLYTSTPITHFSEPLENSRPSYLFLLPPFPFSRCPQDRKSVLRALRFVTRFIDCIIPFTPCFHSSGWCQLALIVLFLFLLITLSCANSSFLYYCSISSGRCRIRCLVCLAISCFLFISFSDSFVEPFRGGIRSCRHGF